MSCEDNRFALLQARHGCVDAPECLESCTAVLVLEQELIGMLTCWEGQPEGLPYLANSSLKNSVDKYPLVVQKQRRDSAVFIKSLNSALLYSANVSGK